MGFARVGSNPISVVNIFYYKVKNNFFNKKEMLILLFKRVLNAFSANGLKNYTKKNFDDAAEWLGRWTANPMCSARVGSNPILVESFAFFYHFAYF